jgi:hypothetical protein
MKDFGEALELRYEVERELNRVAKIIVEPVDRKLTAQKDAASNLIGALEKANFDKDNDVKDDVLAIVKALADAKAKAETDAAKAQTPAVDQARAATAAATAALTRFDAFVTSVTQAPAAGDPPLIAAAVRERLHADANGYTHVLCVGVESAGGETLTRSGIVRTTVRFVGGAQVSYLLWDVAQGRLVAANTAPVLGESEFSLRKGTPGGISVIPLAERTKPSRAP